MFPPPNRAPQHPELVPACQSQLILAERQYNANTMQINCKEQLGTSEKGDNKIGASKGMISI